MPAALMTAAHAEREPGDTPMTGTYVAVVVVEAVIVAGALRARAGLFADAPIDWTIVVVYLVWIVWDGLRRSHRTPTRSKATSSASRSLPWWAVGPVGDGDAAERHHAGRHHRAGATPPGCASCSSTSALPLAMIILSVTVVPFFHRARVYTAYEYLERRFDVRDAHR